jgi:hypothetical protein
MLRSLKNPHIGALLSGALVSTTATATVNVGAGDFPTCTRNSAGKTTLTRYRAPIRPGIVLAQAYTSIANGGYGTYDTDPASGAVVSEFLDAAGSGDDGLGFVLTLDYLNEFTDRTGSQLQGVANTCRNARLMGFKVTAAGAVGVGGTQASMAIASSVYTATFQRAFGRDCMVWCTPIAAAQKACNVTAVSASACSVATFSAAEAAEDNSFYMLVLGWDAKDEHYGMNKLIQVPQRKPRLEAFRISGSGTASIALGSTDASLVDNGTGNYTLIWNRPFVREPIVIATAKAGRAQCLAAATNTGVAVGSFGATGTAADDDINVLVLGFDAADEI